MDGTRVSGVPRNTLGVAPSGDAAAGQKMGARAGQNVAANNTTSPISQALDAAEEITMKASRLKKPDDFKVSKGKSGAERQLEFIKKIKMVEDIKGVDDFKKKFPDENNPDLNSEDYLKQAKEDFPDPYHRYVVLSELAVDYDAQPGDEIYKAIDALEEKFPQCVGLGKEICRAVELLEERQLPLSSDQNGQKIFGQVKDYQTLKNVFDNLQDKQDAAAFTKSVDVELKSLSGQLNCLTGSTEDTHLRAVINDMTALKRVVGMHDNCMETQEQIRRPPPDMKQFDGHRYMTEVLQILEKPFVLEADFQDLHKTMGTENLTQEHFLATKTAYLVRDLPEEMFVNTQIKDSIAAAVRETTDRLALQEEGQKSEGDDYGKIGEQEVSFDGFVHSGDILGDLGVDLTGRSEQTPDQPQSDPADAAKSPDQSEAATSSGEPAAPTVSAAGNLDGLNDKQLMSKQDELLDQARGLQQRKDQNYVSTSSITALSHALNGETDALTALQNVTDQRGTNFAKGLKIAITPQGSDKALQLIPPDKNALQAWAGQEGNNLDDLLRTAMAVLENGGDSSFDPEKVDMELANLKDTISQIDNKIKKKPFMRDMGESIFNRLEYAHEFTVKADQGAVSVGAEVPKEE